MFKASMAVVDVKPSRLKGMLIASAEGSGYTAAFDLVEGLYTLAKGDAIEVLIDEQKPEDLDSYEFCGHGYLAAPEDKGFTLLSLWGILFKFSPPLGLRQGTKYYLCIRRSK